MNHRVLEVSVTAWQHLDDAWAATQELWHDAASAHFERRYWEPLADDVAALHQALEELEEVVAEARSVVRRR